MKHLKLLSTLLIASMLWACSDSASVEETIELTEQEITLVNAIVGDALSDRTDGMISSLYEMTSAQSRIDDNEAEARAESPPAAQFGQQHRNWRGVERDHSYNYDPETGIHSFSFNRSVVNPNFSKSVNLETNIIYTTPAGRFIQYPLRQFHLVNNIRYRGSKNVAMQGQVRFSNSEHQSSWELDNLATFFGEYFTLEGSQSSKGLSGIKNREGRDLLRQYELDLELIDVRIYKPTEEENRLEHLVSGTIEYELYMKHVNDGEEREIRTKGTIDLSADGSALNRIMGLQQHYRLSLSTGEVLDR